MIDEVEFEYKFLEMTRLCGFTFQKQSLKTYYDKLKFEAQDTVFKALDKMADDPPPKLNLKHLKSFISIVKNEGAEFNTSSWNGAECSEEDCINGLIHTTHRGNSYCWRFPRAKGTPR